MCPRTRFLSFPKSPSRFQVSSKTFSGGIPSDGLITNLFETAYVHRAIAQSRLRWLVSDFVIKRGLCFLTGTQAGMNQHHGGLPQERLGRAFVFLNKSTRRCHTSTGLTKTTTLCWLVLAIAILIPRKMQTLSRRYLYMARVC